VENALDAGASRIHLDLEEGGVALIRIVDDGCGIPPAEIPLAFASHATSKLSDVADLDHIATLGFRGEALASIASVARCRMFSRVRGTTLGASVEIEGGRLGEIRESGGPEGTRIEVRDLFFNTPARRRFLKATATELGRCLDIVQRLALAQPGVGFVVTHDGRRAFEVEPAMDLRARVRRTFGAELADALAPVEARDGDTVLSGFVAPPRFARNDTTRQMWFLNGRPLRDKILARVLKDAYRGFIVDGRQSVAFLSLSMDPAKVDVNVHPAKAEVRFRDERRMFGFLVASLRGAVSTLDMATPGERMIDSAARRDGPAPLARQFTLPAPAWQLPPEPRPRELPVFVRESAPAEATPATGAAASPASSEAAAAPRPTPVRGPLLQVGRTYILVANDDGFEIVDQHALHERLTLEDLKAELARGAVEVQRRLVPELVEVGGAAAELVEPHLESLARIGLLLARFGSGTIAVHGVPARFRRSDPSALVHEVIAAVERTGAAPGAEDLLEEILHRTACRSSVMAGDELSELEMRALLARARDESNSQTCAHGRPTRVRFTLADLEKAFYRR
ncbi:MAG: DNA mismatch repair endonuclease MutL, partial [Planctomycetota bacterium]